MMIVGIDPGTATTGYGIIESQGTVRSHVAHGVIRTHYGMPIEERLAMLSDALYGLYRRYEPDVVAMEELFFSSNVKTAISVAQAQGVILLSAFAHRLSVLQYTPNQVKQTVTQNGKASKREVQEMIRILLGLGEIPRPDDAADGLAIALCASQNATWVTRPGNVAHR